jgi:hypothetical protein
MRRKKQVAQKRHVTLDELLLQSFGVRRDQDLLVVGDGPQNQRHQISVAFPVPVPASTSK